MLLREIEEEEDVAVYKWNYIGKRGELRTTEDWHANKGEVQYALFGETYDISKDPEPIELSKRWEIRLTTTTVHAVGFKE